MASIIAASTFSPHLFRHRRRFSPPQASRTDDHHPFARRNLLLSTATMSTFLLPISPASATTPETVGSPTPSTASPKITDRIFMDFSVCPSYFRSDRSIGFELSSCSDSEPLGRIVFGLYGKLVPITVANFKTMCKSGTYRGTLIHKLLEGQYFAAGRQGRKDKGEVRIPLDLVSKNSETVNPKSFQLTHMKPGTLSLSLSENDDYDEVRLDPEYRNVQFLVTTGPGPCPSLDNRNIVFGTVLEGLDILTAIAAIPTYKPSDEIRQFNDLAGFFGDERAQNARGLWNRPLKTVYISDCGELMVIKPTFTPNLP
ncbi:putative Peptidyl-prolyl cis-trans isomerase [Zostera marina]|uniref:Putative Peptidyl-prolyl cis-trans isomerase n=1 Tax=Zostera marina TaxID=29655 RepID=A0A0K9PVF1_ZOSMR|nr:putative Peptidyl-prolyl cis-trans isomerase [Zostera marina]